VKRAKRQRRKTRPGRPGPDATPRVRPAGAPSDGVVTLREHPEPQDDALLERSLTQWQFGDWDSLARLSLDALHDHPDRGKLALLAAAAHFHYQNAEAVRELVDKARAWGCSNSVISRVLLAGVHNSLGRAAAARGDEGRAAGHFEACIATGTPTADARLLARARLALQIEQLDLTGTATPRPCLPRPPG